MFSSTARRCTARFGLGRQKVAPGTMQTLVGQTVLDCFSRHENGDFGDVSDDDFDRNLEAITKGETIVSVYRCADKRGDMVRVRVITEADRSQTTLMLAEEY